MSFRRAITDREHFEILMYVAVTQANVRARAIEYANSLLYRNGWEIDGSPRDGNDGSFGNRHEWQALNAWLTAMRKGDEIPKFPAGFRLPAKDAHNACSCGHTKMLHMPYCRAPDCRCDEFTDYDLPF